MQLCSRTAMKLARVKSEQLSLLTKRKGKWRLNHHQKQVQAATSPLLIQPTCFQKILAFKLSHHNNYQFPARSAFPKIRSHTVMLLPPRCSYFCITPKCPSEQILNCLFCQVIRISALILLAHIYSSSNRWHCKGVHVLNILQRLTVVHWHTAIPTSNTITAHLLPRVVCASHSLGMAEITFIHVSYLIRDSNDKLWAVAVIGLQGC